MKRPIWLLLAAGILVNCNARDGASGQATENDYQHHGHEGKATLSLNNDNKWKADSSTNNNVIELMVIVDEFATSKNKTLLNYHNTAIGLQKGLERMTGECRMKGVDHDALHKWLEPLMKQVSAFQNATNERQAEKEFHSIHERLDLYTTYFE
jgi:hypothetical protein